MFCIPCFLAILSAASSPPSFTWTAKSSSALILATARIKRMRQVVVCLLTITHCHPPILHHPPHTHIFNAWSFPLPCCPASLSLSVTPLRSHAIVTADNEIALVTFLRIWWAHRFQAPICLLFIWNKRRLKSKQGNQFGREWRILGAGGPPRELHCTDWFLTYSQLER